MTQSYSSTVETARTYYNSDDADNFYATIWGGEDIHVGIYTSEQQSIFDASHATVQKIASLLTITPVSQVLDLGSGYGGSARYLAKTFGCHVDCLNLSETQNQRNRQLNQKQDLANQLQVIDGNFESIPKPDQQYDIVWSQDAILHSGNRQQVFEEVYRVLKPGGEFIFTDPMQSDNCPENVLQPVLERLSLESMGSIGLYTQMAEKLGLKTIQIIEMSEQLTTHYSRIQQEIEARRNELAKVCSQEYIARMNVGLNHWIEKGKNGYLAWGILHFQKP
jgi:sarcosine/dimethylglycine N-methyltransferase